MKTTIELPDATFRRAKVVASGRGVTLKQFLTEALDEKLRRYAAGNDDMAEQAPWMAGFGALSGLAGENRRIAAVIEDEFESLEPGDIA